MRQPGIPKGCIFARCVAGVPRKERRLSRELRSRRIDNAAALPDGQISSPRNCGVSSHSAKNISLNASGKSDALIRTSRAERGALANVINAERDAVDADAPLTNGARCGRRSRVVLTPRRWRQVCAKERRRRWQKSPVTGESTKETVKTIARGMPGVSGVTVVTNARAFYTTRAAADASSVRHSLRPLISEGGWILQNSGKTSRGIAKLCRRNARLPSPRPACGERSETKR